MELKEITSGTINDSVYNQLFEAIVSGELSPGQRLTLQGLAKQLNVSVMPVREAIRKLEAVNFVTIEKRRIAVNKLSPENVYQILETRLLLEGYAAEKASLQRSLATMEKLEATLEQMKDASNTDDYIAANKLFHATMYEAGGLPIMFEIIEKLWDRYTPYLVILNKNKERWDSANFLVTHAGMLAGMRRRDPLEVRKWLEKDLTAAAELVVEMLISERDG